MTCIMGGKCVDGVALIGDKKITDGETRQVDYKEKLFIFQKEGFFYPIIVGSSGTIALYDKFRREAIYELEKISPPPPFSPRGFSSRGFNTSVSGTIYSYSSTDNPRQVILYPFIEKLEEIIRKYKGIYRQKFDVLFAAQLRDRGATIHYIRDDGLADDIYEYKAIGSGEIPASVFLKGLYRKDMTMRQFAKVGFFIIKYIEEQGIDNQVGTGRDRPQVYLIPNEGQLVEADSNFLDECEKSKNTMEDNFKKILPN
jgi:20S proteasome alpha/beta subunit